MTCLLVKSVLTLEPGLGPPEDRHPFRRRSPRLLLHISLLVAPGGGRDRRGCCCTTSTATSPLPQKAPT